MTARVGVLALQGDFDAHVQCLKTLGVRAVLVKTPDQLSGIDALILPGGESSTHLFLLGDDGRHALREFARSKPLLATCAGAILLASTVEPHQPSLGAIDMTIQRNAYGRQIDSAIRTGVFDGVQAEMIFIRAPRIVRVGSEVQVLATLDGEPVAVRQGHAVAATYHPELGGDLRLHRMFLTVNGQCPPWTAQTAGGAPESGQSGVRRCRPESRSSTRRDERRSTI